ncbi:MAG: hypothetical protein LBH00_08980 [Planctomycetaceae bacterium]|jgi:hypothetical protein|nr:hypothetical protein [Planctomycetaceae bacterium]
MKTSPFNFSPLTRLPGAVFSFFLAVSFVFADDLTDFEKLLKDSLKLDVAAEIAEPKPIKEKSKPVSPSVKPAAAPAVASASPAAPSASPKIAAAESSGKRGNVKLNESKTAKKSEVISDGWTTVMPNDPNTVVPEPAKAVPPVAAQPIKENHVSEDTAAEIIEPAEPHTISTNEEAVKPEAPAPQEENAEPAEPKSITEHAAQPNSAETEPAVESKPEAGTAPQTADVPAEGKPAEGESAEIVEPKKVSEIQNDIPSENQQQTPDNEPAVEPKKNDEKNNSQESVIRQKLAELETATDQSDEQSNTEGENEKENGGAEKQPTEPKIKEQQPSEEPADPEKTEVIMNIPDFDSDDDETKWSVIKPELFGDMNGRDKIKLMYDEILNGLKTRNISGKYEMWKNYAKSTLRNTAGINTGSELDGRCRLSWYQKLYEDPIQSVFIAEEFTRWLHAGLTGNHRSWAEIMPGIRERMDIPKREDAGIRFPVCTTPLEAVNEVKRCLLIAKSAHARAFAALNNAELKELETNFVSTFCGNDCINGHTIPKRSVGRKHMDIFEKVDKAALYEAAEAMIPLSNPAFLALLDQLPEDALPQIMLNGQKVQRLTTAAGDIIIGGRGNNIYDLDSPEMMDVICVIDLGGNDTYREGTCNMNRPVFAIIDLHGNDVYTGSKPGIQGGSVMGISFLLDAEGDDTYTALDIAQGSTMGGVGILIDLAGNDKYKALRRCQGHALAGLGMLIDKGGNDDYRAAMWAQGFGAPGGFGVLENAEGNDHYYCGGRWLDSYPEHPGYDGWGQGIGAGIRQVANGGIGVLLDGSGDDVYEVDYFGHGGGYWLGVGFARDFAGNDIRHGTTKTMYDGSPRREAEWTRFANGFGCHYSCGYCFDDGGNDVYGGKIMGTGMAWDLSIGYLCDFNGSDKYTATGGMTQGVGAEGSIGILFSYGGDDQFLGRNQGYANSNITYHSPSNCGSNFSFVINYGGNDTYGSGVKNNSYAQRGSLGGFLIDRPTEKEAAENLIALKKQIEDRQREIAEYDAAVAAAKEKAQQEKRRYIPPRQRRPQPIAEPSQQVGAVPSFDSAVPRTGAAEKTVK